MGKRQRKRDRANPRPEETPAMVVAEWDAAALTDQLRRHLAGRRVVPVQRGNARKK